LRNQTLGRISAALPLLLIAEGMFAALTFWKGPQPLYIAIQVAIVVTLFAALMVRILKARRE
jgi:predicted signal transduction protein with EAL and GGDEF domain